jgi:hypothetical protein
MELPIEQYNKRYYCQFEKTKLKSRPILYFVVFLILLFSILAFVNTIQIFVLIESKYMWSKQLPSQPGWYWLKWLNDNNYKEVIHIFPAIAEDEKGLRYADTNGYTGNISVFEKRNCEFSLIEETE